MPVLLALSSTKEHLSFFEDLFASDMEVVGCSDLDVARAALDASDVAVIIAECSATSSEGLQLLTEACQKKPEVVRIAYSRNEDLEAAAKAVNDAQVFWFVAGELEQKVFSEVVNEGLAQRERVIALEKLLDIVEKQSGAVDEELLSMVRTLKQAS